MKLLLENWRIFLKEELLVPTDINKRIISIYDFDETIARSNTEIRVSDKETGQYYKTITTQQEYDRLVADGNYEFDFSNLEYVTDPTELIPVTNKLRNDVERGKMQVIILTARAGNAEGVHFYDDSEKNIRDMEDAKERLIDLDRIRFFTINQVGEDAEIQKRGSSLGSKKDKVDPFSKEIKTKLGPFKGPRTMGTLGPGGRIPEGKKK